MSMVETFPRLERDEILYSAVARYAQLEYLQLRVVNRRLFSAETAMVASDFPARLQFLIQRLPADYPETAQSLLTYHTMFPAVAPILPANKRAEMEQSLINFDGQKRISMGLTRRFMGVRRGFWLCPDCAEIEQRDLGYAYWHRALQLVPYCRAHSRFACFVDQVGDPMHHGYVSADIAYRRLKSFRSYEDDPFLAGMAEDARYLLEDNRCNTDDWRVRMALSNLRERWRSEESRIRRSNFPDVLLLDLSKNTRQILFSIYGKDSEPQNLASVCMLSNRPFSVPAVLILTRLLNASVAQLLADASSMPEQATKWPCPNVNASCCGTLVIRRIRIQCGRAHITCPECGSTYSRRLPIKLPIKTEADELFGSDTLKRPGRKWRAHLVRLWTSGQYNVNEIAKMVGKDRKGVLLIAAGAGLPKIKGSHKQYQPRIRFDDRRAFYRNTIESAMQTFKFTTRAELEKICPREMKWINVWDPEFIRAIFPRILGSRVTFQAKHGNRDQEIAASLDSIVERIRMLWPPKRVTCRALLNAAGIRTMVQKAGLPQTVERARQFEENFEQYAVRRARTGFAEFVAARKATPTWRELMNQGRLEGTCHCNQDVKLAVMLVYEEMMKALGSNEFSYTPIEETKVSAA